MKNNHIFFFCLFLILIIDVAQTAARQCDALENLMKLKKKNMMSATSTSHINGVAVMRYDELLLPQTGSKESNKIDELPGQPGIIDFDQYGGYVTLDERAGRALFYYFVEAVGSDHPSKPLLLWLNGGSGCSSLGYGAMEEIGPFQVKSDGKTLFRNPYAWNNVANVLFLESPAGVGCSYSNTTSDYSSSSDIRTADDSLVFLVNWMERFPEYKSRDFYIAGESYGGHYVPQLAHTILLHNNLANNTRINLKGIAVGNALINEETDVMGMFDYFWTHALMSDEDMDKTRECEQATDYIDLGFQGLDIYNIYAPSCFSSNLTIPPKEASITDFDPCSDNYIEAYLNLPEVQAALHANVTKLNDPWSACSYLFWLDNPSTILPLFQELMEEGIRVWVYSGDIDGRIPVTSTRYSMNNLKLAVKTSWKPWYINKEVGGYSVVYEGDITLATVRGAGHEVPSYQPLRALTLITFFLLGQPLPSDA